MSAGGFSYTKEPHEAKIGSLAARKSEEGSVGDLQLPDGARALAVTRAGEAELARDETRVREHDTVYVVCSQDQVKKLRERFIDD